METSGEKAMQTAVIIGAGPAGLTAALELLRTTGIKPIVIEESGEIGGISRTVQYNGNRMDIGGHRFFSKNQKIMDWWKNILPLQGAPALDDILTGEEKELEKGGPDPEQEDKVMLLRRRVSRIFYLKKFFKYPVSLSVETLANMGFFRTMRVGFGYIGASLFPRKENSLEDFYINRFGRPLYEMFFEHYTEKLWGVHPSKLGADWGAQRVNGISISTILKTVLKQAFKGKDKSLSQKDVEKSLIERFIYPKLGPGQLWESVADQIVALGGEVRKGCLVDGVQVNDGQVKCVSVASASGRETIACDYVLSSMPIKDLVAAIGGITVPEGVRGVASQLPYRDFITVGVLVDKLKIKNKTKFVTYDERVPDTWIYIQERDVKMGRLQIFNNWSPYLVKDFKNTMWLGLEYFCTEGDKMWTMPDAEFKAMAIDELVQIGIIESKKDVLDSTEIRVKKAYPAYYGAYYQLDSVIKWLDGIGNLFCIGRNGQHRYNNMDHSMLTAIEAVNCIATGSTDKSAIWAVNTEQEYHETKA